MKRCKENAAAGKRVLLAFSLSYLLLLLVLILMGMGTYVLSQRLYEEQMVDTGQQMLDGIMAKVESSIEEADRFAHTLYSLKSAHPFATMSQPPQSAQLFHVRQIIGDLPTSIQNASLIELYCLYNAPAEVLVSPGGAYSNLHRAYGATLSYGDLTLDQWQALLLAYRQSSAILPAADYVYSGTASRALLYIKGFPMGGVRNTSILFFINERSLLGLFSPLVENGAQVIGVYDRAGVQLSRHCGDSQLSAWAMDAPPEGHGSQLQRYGGKGYRVIYAQSSSLGWRFAFAVPNDVFATQAARTLVPISVGIAVMLALGICLGITLMLYNRQPLKQIIGALPVHGQGTRNGLWYVAAAITQLANSHHDQARRLEAQRLCLQSALINQLISDGDDTEGTVGDLLSAAELPLEGRRFRGVYLRLRDEIDDMKRASVLDMLDRAPASLTFLAFRDTHSLCLLFSQRGDEDDCLPLLRNLYGLLRVRLGVEMTFYVGISADCLHKAPLSFASARQLMSSEPDPEDSFLLVEQHQRSGLQDALYTQRDEQRLIGLVSAGDEHTVVELLASIRDRCMQSNVLAASFPRRLLYDRFLYTIAQIDIDAQLPLELINSPEALAPDRFFELLGACHIVLCQKMQARRSRRSSQLIEDVMRYIDGHFHDASLSLAKLSMTFDMTENYLSTFIKKEAGVNFSQYLEQLRVRRADELLAREEHTIEEIAALIGYGSVKSFRRAYHRAKGLTPSEYRKQSRSLS